MGTFLYNLLIYPIEMIVEFVFFFFLKAFYNEGLSILAVSIVINILALPLYNIAHNLQKKERDIRINMADGIKRIKTAFKGDEQYMMLSTYYRQHNYHPAYALRSSVSLIIQVPFFIAAYHFLSHLELLQGVSFSFIPDLGAPDQLLHIGGITINVLPIIMTVINVVAGIIYMKGFPARDKVQLYSMAGLFLILLYNSPSGLVLYWTLNNVFSLIKNIFYKLKHPLRIIYVISVIVMFRLSLAFWNMFPSFNVPNLIILVVGNLIVIFLPLILRLGNILYERYLSPLSNNSKQRKILFIFSGLLLFLIYGVLVPANLISSSVTHFSFVGSIENPVLYVFHTATVFFGIWILWTSFIYALMNDKIKTILVFVLCSLSIYSLLNLFVFKGDYGTLNQFLQFEQPALLKPSMFEIVVPVLALGASIMVFLFFFRRKKERYINMFITIITLATFVSAAVATIQITTEFNSYKKNIAKFSSSNGNEVTPYFNLSREGKNVVFIFLDRAISGYFPVAMKEHPDVKEQFKGFTYYPNTVSFGENTILGAPSMVAGYEYTPEAMNARSSEKLVDKHNEALMVIPKIFLDAGFDVRIADPPYSNYTNDADYTPYLKYPEMRVVQQKRKYAIAYKKKFSDVVGFDEEIQSETIKRRLPLFSIFKTAFPIARDILYDKSFYFTSLRGVPEFDKFIETYAQLHFLPDLTQYNAKGNTYTFIGNDTTHEPVLLQVPEYEPRTIVTNTQTPLDDVEGIQLTDREHYHVNVAAMKQLGAWFEQLQKDGVYDNTRIIIVADHGRELYSPHFDGFLEHSRYLTLFNPLYVVKDFDSSGELTIDYTFMTQGDAPLFAIKDLDVSPINPFTKNNLNSFVKKDEVHVYSGPWNPRKNTGNQFTLYPEFSFTVKDSIFEEQNWSLLGDN